MDSLPRLEVFTNCWRPVATEAVIQETKPAAHIDPLLSFGSHNCMPQTDSQLDFDVAFSWLFIDIKPQD